MHWGLVKVSNSPSASVRFPCVCVCVLHMRCKQRFWSVHPYAGTVFSKSLVVLEMADFFVADTDWSHLLRYVIWWLESNISKCIRFFVCVESTALNTSTWMAQAYSFLENRHNHHFLLLFRFQLRIGLMPVCVCAQWWLQRRKPKVEPRTEWKKSFSRSQIIIFSMLREAKNLIYQRKWELT